MSCQPLSLPQPEQLLTELLAVAPRVRLSPTPQAHEWQLQHGPCAIRLRWLNNPIRIEMALQAGELPADAPVAVYQALLAYNGRAGLGRNLRVGTEGAGQTLYVLSDQPAGQCSAAELQTALLDLVDAAQSVQIWLHVQLDRELATADEALAIH